MDHLHSMLSAIRTETKAQKPHLSVFREFLAHLGELQRKAIETPRVKSPPPRKPLKRAKG
jgi:hypothetical protein